MMYKWGHPVATLPSDEGGYMSVLQSHVNSGNHHFITIMNREHAVYSHASFQSSLLTTDSSLQDSKICVEALNV
eukprot:6212048-Pleurochrysis_carterae.AAC.5